MRPCDERGFVHKKLLNIGLGLIPGSNIVKTAIATLAPRVGGFFGGGGIRAQPGV